MMSTFVCFECGFQARLPWRDQNAKKVKPLASRAYATVSRYAISNWTQRTKGLAGGGAV